MRTTCYPLNIVLSFRFSLMGQLLVTERDIVITFFPWSMYSNTSLGNYTACSGGIHPSIIVQPADEVSMCRVLVMTSSRKFPRTTFKKLKLHTNLKKRPGEKYHKFLKYKVLKGNVLPTTCWVPCQYISKRAGILGVVSKKEYKDLTNKAHYQY